MEIVDLLKTVSCSNENLLFSIFNLILLPPQQTPIKGPIHNYDPHNFDDVYADEYGGYGSGMNSGNFRNGNGGGNIGGGRFGNDRGLLNKIFVCKNLEEFVI